MKKNLLFTLLLFIAALQVTAQRKQVPYNPPISNKTDMVFAKNPWGMFRHKIRLIAQNKSIIEIRLQNMDHLQAIRNIDSILAAAWKILQPLKDSFPNDASNRSADMNISPGADAKMRVVTYPPRGSNFVQTKDGLAILKIEQDTLHITGAVQQERPMASLTHTGVTMMNPTGRNTFTVNIPWTITVLINNLSELPTLTGTLNTHMESIVAEYASLTGYNRKNQYYNNINLQYEPFSAFSGKDKFIVYTPYKASKYYFNVQVQSGVQNVQSGFAVSAGVGFGFSNIIFARAGNAYFLMWEPYFFFDKNGAGKMVVQRNDFITFQYKNRFKRVDKDVDINLANNFSIAYLVHRDGDHFNKNTFKFGLPGLEFRNMQLQPQFIFNDLFKQFYPSLKLQVQID